MEFPDIFIKMETIPDLNSIDKPQTKRPRKYTDSYKFAPYIAWSLGGIPPPIITPYQVRELVSMFPLISEAYATSPRYLKRIKERKQLNDKFKKSRPNNMNSYYTLFKSCQLKGYDAFLPYISLPKSRSNIVDNDENGWRHICNTYNWKYIPTV